MIVMNNSTFDLNIKCHIIDSGTLVYDIQLTANDINDVKRKYTMTNLIEDHGYTSLCPDGFDYAPLLDEELGTFSFKFGDGMVNFRFTSTSKCIIEELD